MHIQPRSQGRELMKEKESLARMLLARGLTPKQVRGQLCCSRYFIERIVKELQNEAQQRRQMD